MPASDSPRKVFAVTGGASGIGAAAVALLALLSSCKTSLPLPDDTALPAPARPAAPAAAPQPSAEHVAIARQVVVDWLGEEALISNLQPLTGSEDFSFMLEACPGSYLIVGNGVGETHGTGGCMVHNPGYDFNDRILPVAASYWVQLTEHFLAANAAA